MLRADPEIALGTGIGEGACAHADRGEVGIAPGESRGVAAPPDPFDRANGAARGLDRIADGELFDRDRSVRGGDAGAGTKTGDADRFAAAGIGGDVKGGGGEGAGG